jgi:hypothetical protein
MKKNYKSLEISVKKKIYWDFSNIFSSFLKWIWTEFDSLREYEFWDNIKNIDRKKTAKENKTFVKNYEEEKDLQILFIIENNQTLDFWSETKTKREIIEELFYGLAYSSISNWYSVWSFINSTFLPFKKDESIILNTLKEINTITSKKDIKRKLLKNSLIFYISDNLKPNLVDLKYLNIKNEIIFINIFDYFENNLSLEDFDVNFGTTKTFFSIFWNKKQDYLYFRKQNINILRKELRKKNISYLNIDSRDNLFLKLYKFFNEYKK